MTFEGNFIIEGDPPNTIGWLNKILGSMSIYLCHWRDQGPTGITASIFQTYKEGEQKAERLTKSIVNGNSMFSYFCLASEYSDGFYCGVFVAHATLFSLILYIFRSTPLSPLSQASYPLLVRSRFHCIDQEIKDMPISLSINIFTFKVCIALKSIEEAQAQTQTIRSCYQ